MLVLKPFNSEWGQTKIIQHLLKIYSCISSTETQYQSLKTKTKQTHT